MPFVNVTIERFLEKGQPGWVETSVNDAWNKTHLFIDKSVIFSELYLDVESLYPQAGVLACEVIKEWIDQNGRNIVTVTTERPYDVATTEALYEIDLLEEQLIYDASPNLE